MKKTPTRLVIWVPAFLAIVIAVILARTPEAETASVTPSDTIVDVSDEAEAPPIAAPNAESVADASRLGN
jgi:hypothetical protein